MDVAPAENWDLYERRTLVHKIYLPVYPEARGYKLGFH